MLFRPLVRSLVRPLVRSPLESRGLRPSLSLDFANGGVIDSRITFSGGANGTRVNSAGVIVAATAPRIDYDPVTLAARGLLVEEARTNLLLNSLLNGTNLSTQSVTVAATPYTLSFYGTGTVTLSGVSTAGPAVGSGAYPARTTLTFTPTAGSLTLTVAGTVQFAQLEAGSFATSFIPTAGASVTRSADSAVMTGTNFSSWYNQTQGTFVCTGDLTGGSAATFPFICAATSVTPNSDAIGVLWTADSSVLRGNIYVGGGNTVNIAAGPSLVAGSAFSAALAYAVNDSSFASAGVLGTPDTSGALPTCTQLLIGGPAIFQPYLNGHVRSIRYFPQRLANATLQSLTA